MKIFIALLSFAFALKPDPPRDNIYTIQTEASYFTTNRNYTSGGVSRSLINRGSLTHTAADGVFALELQRRIRLFAGLSLARTDSTYGEIGLSSQGLKDGLIGGQYWLNAGSFLLAPSLEFTYPFRRADESSGSPLISEGAVRTEVGAWGIWRINRFQPFGYAGYAHRDAGRSQLMTFSAGAYWRPAAYWIQGEYRGFVSVTKDSDASNRTARDTYLARVDGGSATFAAVTPSQSEAALQAGYRFGGALNIYGGYAMTVNGNDAADGWTATAGIIYAARAGAPSGAPSLQTSEGFHPQSEKFDESLFVDDKAPADPTKVKRKVRKTPSVDKLLNETERELDPLDSP